MFDEQDELVERIAGQLRPLPEVDAAAKARVLVAVATERERDRERASRRRPRVFGWTVAAGLAATVMFAAFLVRRGRERSAPIAAAALARGPVPAQVPTSSAATLVARDVGGSTAPQRVQLVFRAPNAHHVSVVGDFTGWDASKAVMSRDTGSGLWTVTLALPAGRHVYAFLVNDSVWVRDPRAPSAPDADFGRPGSVLLVGRP